jgi:hypothetical protein
LHLAGEDVAALVCVGRTRAIREDDLKHGDTAGIQRTILAESVRELQHLRPVAEHGRSRRQLLRDKNSPYKFTAKQVGRHTSGN